MDSRGARFPTPVGTSERDLQRCSRLSGISRVSHYPPTGGHGERDLRGRSPERDLRGCSFEQ
eukprot:9134950-Pyramimonas_sp.AAC.1